MDITEPDVQHSILAAGSMAASGDILTPANIASYAEKLNIQQQESPDKKMAVSPGSKVTCDYSGITANIEIQSATTKITPQLLLKCATNVQRKNDILKKQGQNKFLEQITHLSL